MRNWEPARLRDVSVHLASREEGIGLITRDDDYLAGLTPFDLQLRVHRREATIEDYLDNCRSSVLEFDDCETELLNGVFGEISSRLDHHNMVIPKVRSINVVKTTLKEEGNMGAYTRGNTIYLSETFLHRGVALLRHIVCHELFHILTRSSADFKKDIYRAINFHVIDKIMDLNHYDGFRYVSNPDVSNQCSYVIMEDSNHERRAYYMGTLVPKESDSEDLRSCLKPWFFPLDSQSEIMRDESGNPVMVPFGEMREQFFGQVGRNTQYVINPEEILAENFSIAVLGSIKGLPNPEVIFGIYNIMGSVLR